MTGVRRQPGRGGALNMGGAMALEDMHLDRKADFEGDAFDPFKVGRSGQNAFGGNLEL